MGDGISRAVTTTRVITYTYDPLNRLVGAEYSTGEQFEYTYNAVGNRTAMTSTTPLSGTLVTTYTFDAANRLTDRAVSDGRSYTYDWSARGQMLAEYTQGYPVRTFTYDGAGRMIEATVFTLTTRFTYNGLGDRVSVEVVGQGVTTYTLDLAAGGRILAEETDAGSTLYLHGRDCLGQFEDAEWLYYLNDVEGVVRQGADEQGEVVSGWLFDPDGTVLEGPEGPVSHLVCGGVYDWSTGLIYEDGRYFDPMLGIWLALAPLVVVQWWRGRKRKRRGFPWYVVVLLGVCVGGLLTACENGTPTPEDLEKICVEVPKNPLVGVRINRSPEVGYGVLSQENPDENVYRLMLGSFEGGIENRGAQFQGEADIAAGVEGSLELVQNIKSSNVYIFADYSQQIFSGDWGLDERDPCESESCTPGTRCLVGATDNPANDLSQFVDEQGKPVLTEEGEPVLKYLTTECVKYCETTVNRI